MRLLFAAWLVVTCLAGAGCAPLQPYRTEPPAAAYDPARHDCDPSREDSDDAGDIGGKVDARCATRIREDASNYRLYFTEFDDQGWAYPDDAQYGAAGKQIGIFVDEIKRSLVQNDERVSIVVFVHGWKHNAHSDDSNVRRFRSLLDSLDLVERTTGCGRHVVGVYVGWRGSSTTLGGPAANLTFYSRKSAAERVALGDVRLLFSHPRAAGHGQPALDRACAARADRAGRRGRARSMRQAHAAVDRGPQLRRPHRLHLARAGADPRCRRTAPGRGRGAPEERHTADDVA